jgi:hypothetical protein
MTGGLYSNVSSHATGFFPAVSVVWHIKIHGRESGNDLSTLGIMELLTLNLIQSVSPLQPCTCQSQISVLSCCSSATIAGTSIGNCCPTQARAMKILRTPLTAPRRWPVSTSVCTSARQEDRKPEHSGQASAMMWHDPSKAKYP